MEKTVKTYSEYMRLLENEITRNGKKELTDTQIQSFITKYNLDRDWNIGQKEVRIDTGSILKKYRINPAAGKHNSTVNNVSRSTTTRRKKVNTYDEYKRLLEAEVRWNNDQPLTSWQIGTFIKMYDLKSDWNINSGDVSKDLSAIYKKLHNQSAGNQVGTDDDHKKKTEVMSNNAQKKQNTISQKRNGSDINNDDLKLAEKINIVFNRYPDIGDNVIRWRGVFSDILQGRKIEINLLSFLVEGGIIKAINASDSINVFLYDRFVGMLKNDYGTDPVVAGRMVLIWIHGYGVLYRKKRFEKW